MIKTQTEASHWQSPRWVEQRGPSGGERVPAGGSAPNPTPVSSVPSIPRNGGGRASPRQAVLSPQWAHWSTSQPNSADTEFLRETTQNAPKCPKAPTDTTGTREFQPKGREARTSPGGSEGLDRRLSGAPHLRARGTRPGRADGAGKLPTFCMEAPWTQGQTLAPWSSGVGTNTH